MKPPITLLALWVTQDNFYQVEVGTRDKGVFVGRGETISEALEQLSKVMKGADL